MRNDSHHKECHSFYSEQMETVSAVKLHFCPDLDVAPTETSVLHRPAVFKEMLRFEDKSWRLYSHSPHGTVHGSDDGASILY